MTLHPQQAKLKLQRVKNYLELRREEVRLNRQKGERGTRILQRAIAIMNKAIKDIDKQYYIRGLWMNYLVVWAAEDRKTQELVIGTQKFGKVDLEC